MIPPAYRAQDQLFIPGPFWLLEQNNPYRLFAQVVMPQMMQARPPLSACYCQNDGRPPVDPCLLLGVSLLQFLEGVTDRQAVDRLQYHIGWAYAVGHEIGTPVFHPTTLVYFRKRLLKNKQAGLAFDTILTALEASGLLPRRRKERLDSTQVLGLVSHMSRLECCRETLRGALKELRQQLTPTWQPPWWASFWERYVESRFDFRAPPKVLAEKLQQTGQDGAQLLAWVKGLDKVDVGGGKKMALLKRVWEEQFELVPAPAAASSTVSKEGVAGTKLQVNPKAEPADPTPAPLETGTSAQPPAPSGSPSNAIPAATPIADLTDRTPPAPPGSRSPEPATAVEPKETTPSLGATTVPLLQPKVAAPPGAVHNPHEPEAQWAAKGTGRHRKEGVGYKIQVAESLDDAPLAPGEPTRQFLTALLTQPAIGSDEAGLELIRAQKQASHQELPLAEYVDAAYISAEKLAQAQASGVPLIGPAQPAPEKGNRFTAEAFKVDIGQRQAVCPAGQPSTQCSRLEIQATGKVNFRFEWSYLCADCSLRRQCCAPDQKHRTLLVGQYHDFLQARRQEQKTEAFHLECRKRNAIEGTQSELVRAHGVRWARYRGLAKVDLQNQMIGAACNVKRWIRRLQWQARQEQCVPAATKNN